MVRRKLSEESGKETDPDQGLRSDRGGCGIVFWIGSYDFPDTYNIGLDFYRQVTTYQTTGFVPAFISFWQRMKISKPDGYMEQSAEQIFNEYGAAETEKKDNGEQPMIITIMNESFSDLSVLGPLACTEDDLSFFHSLKDDPHTIEYGWDYVSTRVGGTSTTESNI